MNAWIEYIRKCNEEFESLEFPKSVVEPNLSLSPKRILELYSAGIPVNVSHLGDYDDYKDDDSDFDFATLEDEFEVEDYLRDQASKREARRLKRKTDEEQSSPDKPSLDKPSPEPKSEDKPSEIEKKGAE